MTFKVLVLETRLRLHDYREKGGLPITNALQDGIRWSSSQVQSLCKGALSNMLRTFSGLKNIDRMKNHVNLSVLTRLDDIDILGTAGDVGQAFPPEGAYKILRLQENTDRRHIYLPVEPEIIFSKNWLQQVPETIERVFCQFRGGPSADTRYLAVIPNPGNGKTLDADVVYQINPEELFSLATDDELPFQDIDDLILDYCEVEGRVIEHNPQQVQLVQAMIDKKLQELGYEIPRNKG